MSIAASLCCNAAPEMRDAATNDDLTGKFRKASAENPLRKMKPKEVTGVDPTKVNQPEDLMATSDFITFKGISTLVPKKAILCIPKNYADRIKFVPGTKIVVWSDFFLENRGWIKTMEVTRSQAEGVEPFDEKVAEGLQKSSILVVATYKGGPISVLPPKKTVEEQPKDPKDPKELKTKDAK